MTGVCPTCQGSFAVSSHRGSSLRGHLCPQDGSQLVGRTALYCNVRCRGTYWVDAQRDWITVPEGQGERRTYTANCSRPRGHELPHGSADGKRVYEGPIPPRCGFVGYEEQYLGHSSFRYRCEQDRGHTGDHRSRYYRLIANGKS